jgi:hypothetical protein
MASPIGLSIVDESVFALQDIKPGLEKVYFTLEQDMMRPAYTIRGFDMPSLVRMEG